MAVTLDDELHDPMIIPPTSRCFCKDSTDSEEFGLVKARPSPNINIAEWWSGEGNQVNEELSIFFSARVIGKSRSIVMFKKTKNLLNSKIF